MLNTFSSNAFPLTSREMRILSRHSRLEYWAFAQHCCSMVNNLFGNKVFTFFVIDSSDLSLVIASDRLPSSSRANVRSFSASSNLLYENKRIAIGPCLRSLSSESLEYDAIFQLDKLSKKNLQIGEVVNQNTTSRAINEHTFATATHRYTLGVNLCE